MNCPRCGRDDNMVCAMHVKRQILVHIGTSKAGSSTIQRVLGMLRPKLAERNVHIPPGSPRSPQRARHAFLSGEARRRLEDEINASKAHRFFLSNETVLSPYRRREEGPRAIARIAASCGLEVDIVAFVRPQCQYFESNYAQSVSIGNQLLPFDLVTAASFVARPASLHPWLGYRRVFAPWLAAFGERLHVVPLEASRLPHGPVVHLLKMLRADDLTGPPRLRAKRRPGAKRVEVLRLAASAMREHGRSSQGLLKRLRGLRHLLTDDAPFTGFTATEATDLMSAFRAENAAFAREYGIDHDGVLFRDPVLGDLSRPTAVQWHDLAADERCDVREFVKERLNIDPAPRATRRAGRVKAHGAKTRLGSTRWRLYWLLQPRFFCPVAKALAMRKARRRKRAANWS